MRRRGAGIGVSTDPVLVAGTARLSDRRVRLCLSENLQVMGRWLERPYYSPFRWSPRRRRSSSLQASDERRDGPPFYMGALVFAAAFGTFAITFWPYMIPFSITVDQARHRIRVSRSCSGEKAFSSSPHAHLYSDYLQGVPRKVQSTSHHY